MIEASRFKRGTCIVYKDAPMTVELIEPPIVVK